MVFMRATLYTHPKAHNAVGAIAVAVLAAAEVASMVAADVSGTKTVAAAASDSSRRVSGGRNSI